MNTDNTEMQPVADGVSQSALIRRCKTLLLILMGVIAGHFLWQATHDCNWTQAERYAVWDAITLMLALMLPYK